MAQQQASVQPAGFQDAVSGLGGAANDAEGWWQKNVENPVHSFVGKLPVIGGIDQMINGTGSFAPISTGMTDAAASDANQLRNGVVGQYAGLTPGSAPTMQ